MITIDTILNQIKKWVQDKTPIAPNIWIDASAKLNILISEEHDKLFDLQQVIAKMKVAWIADGDTVAKAKSKVEAEDLYRDMCKQRAKIEMIEEMIRISKLQARMKNDEVRNY